MSKEHKHGLPSEGELADDELEISGGAGDEPAQNAAGRGVGPSPGDSSGDNRQPAVMLCEFSLLLWPST